MSGAGSLAPAPSRRRPSTSPTKVETSGEACPGEVQLNDIIKRFFSLAAGSAEYPGQLVSVHVRAGGGEPLSEEMHQFRNAVPPNSRDWLGAAPPTETVLRMQTAEVEVQFSSAYRTT